MESSAKKLGVANLVTASTFGYAVLGTKNPAVGRNWIELFVSKHYNRKPLTFFSM